METWNWVHKLNFIWSIFEIVNGWKTKNCVFSGCNKLFKIKSTQIPRQFTKYLYFLVFVAKNWHFKTFICEKLFLFFFRDHGWIFWVNIDICRGYKISIDITFIYLEILPFSRKSSEKNYCNFFKIWTKSEVSFF